MSADAPHDAKDSAPPDSAAQPPEEEPVDPNAYRVTLPSFEGPLDLLLHLIQQHELDIFDIPIRFIAQKYNEYLRLMSELNIDVASEYLVMAATLAHIKSKMLLPPDPNEEDGEGEQEEAEDPRSELIRRLLEYQKYRQAADELGSRSVLGRDIFLRGSESPTVDGPAPLAQMGVFKLLDAFKSVLARVQKTMDHEVNLERFSITDRINELTDVLRAKPRCEFRELFEKDASRAEVIVTFLAVLEMTRLRMIRVAQDGPLADIFIELALSAADTDDANIADEDDAETAIDGEEQNAGEDAEAPVHEDEDDRAQRTAVHEGEDEDAGADEDNEDDEDDEDEDDAEELGEGALRDDRERPEDEGSEQEGVVEVPAQRAASDDSSAAAESQEGSEAAVERVEDGKSETVADAGEQESLFEAAVEQVGDGDRPEGVVVEAGEQVGDSSQPEALVEAGEQESLVEAAREQVRDSEGGEQVSEEEADDRGSREDELQGIVSEESVVQGGEQDSEEEADDRESRGDELQDIVGEEGVVQSGQQEEAGEQEEAAVRGDRGHGSEGPVSGDVYGREDRERATDEPGVGSDRVAERRVFGRDPERSDAEEEEEKEEEGSAGRDSGTGPGGS